MSITRSISTLTWHIDELPIQHLVTIWSYRIFVLLSPVKANNHLTLTAWSKRTSTKGWYDRSLSKKLSVIFFNTVKLTHLFPQLGSDVYLCYKKSMNKPRYIAYRPGESCWRLPFQCKLDLFWNQGSKRATHRRTSRTFHFLIRFHCSAYQWEQHSSGGQPRPAHRSLSSLLSSWPYRTQPKKYTL